MGIVKKVIVIFFMILIVAAFIMTVSGYATWKFFWMIAIIAAVMAWLILPKVPNEW